MSYAVSVRNVFAYKLGTLHYLVLKAQEAGMGEQVLEEQVGSFAPTITLA